MKDLIDRQAAINGAENEPTCYGCKYLIGAFGNYVECRKTAEHGTHMFVDWFYWNNGSPKDCPLRKEANHE